MDMKTTIIELLNKLSKGEEVPKTIIFRGEQYWFFEGNYAYANENNCERWLFDDLFEILDILNDHVEIIEETEEIDIDSIEELKLEHLTEQEHNNADIYVFGCHINALTKAVKQINNKLNNLNC